MSHLQSRHEISHQLQLLLGLALLSDQDRHTLAAKLTNTFNLHRLQDKDPASQKRFGSCFSEDV